MMNKFNLKSFITCLIMVFVLLFAVACNKNKFQDKGEVGNYYAFAGNDEYTLKLDQNKFTFEGLEEDLNGKYAFDGTNLTITFADNTEVAVNYLSDKLSFVYKGTEYVFYRENNVTVTYDTKDGTDVADALVQAGDNANKPADPEKAGYTFIAWYKDAAYTTLYDFNEPVTEDVTVYARFGINTDSFNEFKVTYETGDANVVVNDTTTFHNAVYVLPQVEVAGKTFVGWWMSDYNDATKLTRQYNAGDYIGEDTVLYAVYKTNYVAISVNEGVITWDNKGLGVQYTVNIKNANTLAVLNNGGHGELLSTNRYAFNFADLDCGNYLVEVTTNKGYTTTAYYCNKGLNNVSNFKVVDNKIVWNAVEGADKYVISYTCTNNKHYHENIEVATNEYDFSDCGMPENGINFTVKAATEGYYATYSKVYNVKRELAEVKNVVLGVDNNKPVITWDAVDGATNYKVAINDGTKTEVYYVNENKYDASYLYGAYTVEVTPVRATYYAKTTTQNINKTQLVTPTNIHILGYDLMWDAVEGATSYVIIIGSDRYTSDTNKYFLGKDVIDNVNEFAIKIKAVAADAANNSYFSNIASINKNGVEEVHYSNGVITWNSVPGVFKYAVKVDDGAVEYVDNDNKFAKIIVDGEHTIKVAVADAEGEYGTFKEYNVVVYKLTYNTQGAAMEPRYFVVGDKVGALPAATRPGYNFTNWYIDGELFTKQVFDVAADMTIDAQWSGKTYTVTYNYGIGEGTETTKDVVYGDDYQLTVPTSESSLKAFAGWYTQPNGQGVQLTNEFGDSKYPWGIVVNSTAYAYWADVFTFSLVNNGTEYAVKLGKGTSLVTELRVPVTYEDKPVTTIEAAAFASCEKLKNIYIPQTIKNIEVGSGPNSTGCAFKGCTVLQHVYIYDVEGAIEEDCRYFDIDGVLIYKNEYNGVEIKYVPYATKEGIYTIPDCVTTLPLNTFKSCSKITEVVVPYTVTKIDEYAFSSMAALTKVTFTAAPAGVAESELNLANKAFASSSKLAEVNFPARLTDFNVELFYNCTSLASVNITGTYNGAVFSSKDGVLFTADGTELLYYPKAREGAYTTPVGCTKIGNNAASGATKLTALTVSGQVAYIGMSAFSGCLGLESIVFQGTKDDSALTICEKAFYGANNASFTEIVLPENLNCMKANAFGGTTALFTVTVNSVGDIDFATGAFATIDTTPQYYVTTVNISKDVVTFNVTGVFGAVRLVQINVDKNNKNYASVDGVLFDKNITKIIYYPAAKTGAYVIPPTVTEIGYGIFEGRSSLTAITIGANVTKIDDNAFKNCRLLQTVTFVAGGTENLTIGANAFYMCDGLQAIQLPVRTVSIGDGAFNQCFGLLSFVIPEGVTTLGTEVFKNCTRLTTLSIPSTLTNIPETEGTDTNDTVSRIRLTVGCVSLAQFIVAENNPKYFADTYGILYAKNYEGEVLKDYELLICPQKVSGVVDLDKKVSIINNRAFYNCTDVTEIKFSQGVEGTLLIEQYAFYNNTALTKVQLPNGLESIEQDVFTNCTNLKEIYIPNTVKTISMKAFANCTELDTVTFEDGGSNTLSFLDGKVETVTINGSSVALYYGIFYQCNKIETLVLPERTVKMGRYAFCSMYGLKSINVPSGVTNIEDYVFYLDSNLDTVNISSNAALTNIGTYAFSGTNITSINIPEGVETLGAQAFGDCYNLTNVVIPSTVKIIPVSIFKSDKKLTTVTITDTAEHPSQLTQINAYGFGHYTPGYACGITELRLPASIKNIYANAFSNCANLTHIYFGTKEVTYFAGTENEVTCQVSDLSVVLASAFAKCGLVEFTFPFTGYDEAGALKEISWKETTSGLPGKVPIGGDDNEGMLFPGCVDLVKVTLSASVKKITNLFRQCSSIREVVISENSENFNIQNDSPIIMSVDGKTYYFAYTGVTGELVIPEGVTEIGDNAFINQTGITKVVLPSTLCKVGARAFKECLNLREVVFHADSVFPNVTTTTVNALGRSTTTVASSIGSYTFHNCENLEKVTLPGSLKIIPSYMFTGCTKLSEVIMPNDVENIQTYAFATCLSLEEIDIPSTVTTFGSGAFEYTGLKSVHVTKAMMNPKTGTTPGSTYLFAYCDKLETVTFETGVTHLGNSTFYACTNLKTVELPSTLLFIPANCFAFSGLTSINIPASVKHIGNLTSADPTTSSTGQSFNGCADLASVTFEAGSVCKFICNGTFLNCTSLKSIELPTSLTAMYDRAFKGSGIESITLPSSVTTVGVSTTAVINIGSTVGTFADCKSLKTFDASACSNLKVLNSQLFHNCTNLETVLLPTSITTVYGHVFANCEKLTAISLPNATTIHTEVFSNCKALSSVTLSNNLTTLPNKLFVNCESLESITLPANLTVLGNNTFVGSGLKSITLPANMEVIGGTAATATNATAVSNVFNQCTQLETVTLGANAKFICANTFENCTALKTVNFNDVLIGIGPRAFAGCTQLENVTLPATVRELGEGVFSGTAIKSITLPDAVLAIPDSCFENCQYLTTLNMSEDVVSYGDYAFYNTGLVRFTIGASVTSIGYAAFNDCRDLILDVNADNAKYYMDNVYLCETGKKIVSVPYLSGDVTLEAGYAIGQYAFHGLADVDTFTLPSWYSHITTASFACFNPTKVVFESTHVRINSYAFYNSGVAEIEGTENIWFIDTLSFAGCANLRTFTTGDDLSTLYDQAFMNSGIESFTVPAGITVIGRHNANILTNTNTQFVYGYTFYGCTNLKTVVLPEGLEEIPAYTFAESGVENIVLPTTVQTIGYKAFYGCPNLKSVTINSDVLLCEDNNTSTTANVGGALFAGSTNLETITINGSIDKVPAYMCDSCTSLKSIVISNGVTKIGKYAFYGCTDLASVTLNEGVVDINDYAFYGCGLVNLVTPSTVETIGKYAFAYCTALKNVQLNEGVFYLGASVTTLETGATAGGTFEGCVSLESVTLPASLSYMTNATFKDCTSISSIVIPNSVIFVGLNAFEGWTENQHIYVESDLRGITGIWARTATVGAVTNQNAFTGCNAQITYGYVAPTND